jgi:hypothetical protein
MSKPCKVDNALAKVGHARYCSKSALEAILKDLKEILLDEEEIILE